MHLPYTTTNSKWGLTNLPPPSPTYIMGNNPDLRILTEGLYMIEGEQGSMVNKKRKHSRWKLKVEPDVNPGTTTQEG